MGGTEMSYKFTGAMAGEWEGTCGFRCCSQVLGEGVMAQKERALHIYCRSQQAVKNTNGNVYV